MSKCDISINTNRTNYLLGDTVKGQVTVEVNKECKCDGLVLKKYWRTHGKGNRSSGGREALNLFQGVWQPGIYTYSFSFELNDGPFSYHGHYINVDWYLSAQADIPWAIDPADEVEFILEKGTEELPDNLSGYEMHHVDDKVSSIQDFGVFKYFPLLFVIAGVAIIYYEQSYLFGGIFSIVGAVVFYKVIQSSIAEKKLGNVECSIDENNVNAGENISFTIAFTPNTDITINAASVKLIGKEVAVSGSGTKKTTHTHTLYANETAILSRGTFTKGMPVRDKCRFDIPLDAAPSFNASDNCISWTLDIEIDIPRWPDWENSLPVNVRP